MKRVVPMKVGGADKETELTIDRKINNEGWHMDI